jgi:hypothetical protein
MNGPYTTITVDEYNHLAATMKALRKQLQEVRELLERGLTEKALEILRAEEI